MCHLRIMYSCKVHAQVVSIWWDFHRWDGNLACCPHCYVKILLKWNEEIRTWLEHILLNSIGNIYSHIIIFRVVTISYYKKIRKVSRTSPVMIASNHSLQALRYNFWKPYGSFWLAFNMLLFWSESGHFKSLESYNGRSHLYATRNDLASGFMSAPIVRISPSSTPDRSSLD